MIGVTLYSGDGPRKAFDLSRDWIAEHHPHVVCVHSWPGDDDLPLLRELRKVHSGEVWFSPGANSLAAKSAAENRRQGAEWGRWARANGVSCVMPNIERASRVGLPGWVVDSPTTRASLEAPLGAMLDGLGASGVRVAITSHDWPDAHPLPRLAYTHEAVSLVLPQVYPATGTARDKLCSRLTVAGRLGATIARWNRYAHVKPALRPGQPGWGIYGQLWGHEQGATAWLADQADVVLGWALPMIPKGRAQAEGLAGLEIALAARSLCGDSHGAIKRAQAAKGLAIDGVAGPLTAAALGVPWL